MIEVTKADEVNTIKNSKIRNYLEKRLEEVGYELDPEKDGCFLYVEVFSLLYENQVLGHVTLPSIADGLFNCVEGVSTEGDIVEISLLFNNEFLLSLVFYGLDDRSLEIFTKEKNFEENNT